MDSTAPATKADIAMIMEQIGNLYDSCERWKNELYDSLSAKMQTYKEELHEDFLLIAEDLRHEMLGIHHDKIELLNDRAIDHERRIRVLEAKRY